MFGSGLTWATGGGEKERAQPTVTRSRAKGHRIIFLDPDTGLEPERPSLKHVLESELGEIWEQMAPGDVLVFYQHRTNRSGEPWVDAKRTQFENALGLKRRAAKVAGLENLAGDIVLFYRQKGRAPAKSGAATEQLQSE